MKESSGEEESAGDGDSNMGDEIDEEMIVDNEDAVAPNQQDHMDMAAVGTTAGSLVVATTIATSGHPRTISISGGTDI